MEDPTLMPQMTCTVENGVYVSNFGGQDLYQVNAQELNPDELDPNHEIVSLSGAELTSCQREQNVKLEENPGQYIPDCDENGKYISEQCYAFLAVHACWCVDENGIEKEDFRVQFGEMDNPCWCSTSIGNEIYGTKQYFADFFGRMTKPNCDIYADGGPCN